MKLNLLLASVVFAPGIAIEAATGFAQVSTAPGQSTGMGQSMMSGPMMLACGVFALLALTLIVLGIAALLKYLRK